MASNFTAIVFLEMSLRLLLPSRSGSCRLEKNPTWVEGKEGQSAYITM